MKTLLTLLLALTTITVSAQFQATTTTKAVEDSTTTLTYTDSKYITHQLYVGTTGSLYYPRVSKNTGNYYRQYLDKDIYINSVEYIMFMDARKRMSEL